MKRNTKAFTLVELIIVIAVIGVLAAVLIPTFANVIDKANDAKNRQDASNAYKKYISTQITEAGADVSGDFVAVAKDGRVYSLALQGGFEQIEATKNGIIAAGFVAVYSFGEITLYSGDLGLINNTYTQFEPENLPVTFEQISMVTEYMKSKGIHGDGCQWNVSMEGSTDGKLMLYGTDVAGMFKSTDGGKTWAQCNTGYCNRGAGMFAIDPKNSNHALVLGLDGNTEGTFGMHISYDGANTWTPTGFNKIVSGYRYLWDGLEFDITSYDSDSDLTKNVYYSIPYERDRTVRGHVFQLAAKTGSLAKEDAGLYKSTDGGHSFTQISTNEKLADGIVKITDNGNIFVGNQHGLFRVDESGNILNSYLLNQFNDYSETRTETFTDPWGYGDSTFDVPKSYFGVTGLDCVGNIVYCQTWEGIYTLNLNGVSRNTESGVTPNLINSTNYKTRNWAQFLTVSKSNPNHMIYQYRYTLTPQTWESYYVSYVDVSFDGGKTWQMATSDDDTVFTSQTKFGNEPSMHGREKIFIINAADDNQVITFGADTLMYSDNGGKSFVQANGVSNMMVGGKMNYNYHNPNLLMFGAQDYFGVISTNGGDTWKKLTIKIGDTYYGNFYGAFAADENTIFGFAGTGWSTPRHLLVSFDGGTTWKDTGKVYSEDSSKTYTTNTYLQSMQSYNDPDILFAEKFISRDKGKTWNEMNGCVKILTINPDGKHELFGADKNGSIVMSSDDGTTWQTVFDRTTHNYFEHNSFTTYDEYILDLAYDQVNNYVYALVESHVNSWSASYLYKIRLDDDFKAVYSEKRDITPIRDENGWGWYRAVEIDPHSTNVVYLAACGNYYNHKYSLRRSIDGGETFSCLTSNTDSTLPSIATNTGGFEVTALMVHHITGELYYGSGCYGFGKVNPPYKK